jgi:hypothetical protein
MVLELTAFQDTLHGEKAAKKTGKDAQKTPEESIFSFVYVRSRKKKGLSAAKLPVRLESHRVGASSLMSAL